MIFNSNLDRALWAMISSYSGNRDDIVYFIKTLPKEIYDDVFDSLNKKSHGTFSTVSKKLDVFPILKYHYVIDICNNNCNKIVNINCINIFRYTHYIYEYLLCSYQSN